MFTRKELKKDTERIIAGLERRGEKDARSQIETILRGLGGSGGKRREMTGKQCGTEEKTEETGENSGGKGYFEPHNKYPNRDI